MKINIEWHKAHKMPKRPTTEQRIAWHLNHAKNCNCRTISEKLLTEMKRMGIEVPKSNV